MDSSDMFRPPVNRAMKALDRSFFKKRIPISAARVFENTHISRVRKDLERSKDILNLPRFATTRTDPSPERANNKCILLRPEVNDDGSSHPWTHTVDELRSTKVIDVIPFQLDLEYRDWSYIDIMNAVLPLDEMGEIPTGFSSVGHVAHFNLRDQYLPYRDLIGELIIDKCQNIRTAINKIDDVGEENAYRTFRYEVLAGPDDLNVELKEQDCIFRFDYSKVYWNSRLQAEHTRLVELFQPGQVICDVMGGIGPFAIPAGRKHCFVWANDLNPESYAALVRGIQTNKVGQFVRPFNQDGHTFIKSAVLDLLATTHTATIETKGPAPPPAPATPGQPRPRRMHPTITTTHTQPHFFSHFIMNLPASATDFLSDFIGLYATLPDSQRPTAMPMVHCYCFETKSADNAAETQRICALASEKLGAEIRHGVGETRVYDVRDVAPKKRMFCLSFRLPEEVAYRVVS